MTIPKNKKELIQAIKFEYQNLIDEIKDICINKINEEKLTENISMHDLIAYQIGWGKLLINWYEKGLKNEIFDMPLKGYKWNQLGLLSKKFYLDYKNFTFSTLLKIFENTHQKIINIVENESNKNLYTQGIFKWTGSNPKWPLGRWINVNSSSPYKSARIKIREWKRTSNI